MMRATGSDSRERGSGALLLVAVLLPLMFMAMALTVELNSFLSERQRLQHEVDDVARRMLRGGLSQSEGERLLRSRLAERSAFVAVKSLESAKSGGKTQIEVNARYKPTFVKLIPGASTSALQGIPFTLSSVVSRVPYDVTLVVDRSIGVGESQCGGEFQEIKRFGVKLASLFSELGAATLNLAVLDPESGEAISLANGTSLVPFARCNPEQLEVSSMEILDNTAGSEDTPADPFIAPVSVQEVVFSEGASGTFSRKQVLVLLTTGFDDRWRSLSSLPQLIRESVRGAEIEVSLVDVIVGAGGRECDLNWGSESVSGVRSRCLQLAGSDGLNGTLLTALVSEAGEAVLER